MNGAAAVKTTSPVLNLDASPDLKTDGHSDDEDVKMSEDEDETPTPPTPSAGMNGDGLKRKREEDDEVDVKTDSDASKSPAKRVKSNSPLPPPPPPPEPPVDSPPMQSDGWSPADVAKALHADTSFADKSMADVLAEAQQDSGDGDDLTGVSLQDANDSFVNVIKDARESPHLNDIGEHDPLSPSRLQNGHSPRLKAKYNDIKAES